MTFPNSIKRAVNRIFCSKTLYLSLYGKSSARKEIKIAGNLLAARVITKEGIVTGNSQFASTHSHAHLVPRALPPPAEHLVPRALPPRAEHLVPRTLPPRAEHLVPRRRENVSKEKTIN